MQVYIVALFLFSNIIGIIAWTTLDATWTVNCNNGRSISGIHTIPSNSHEDRSWSISCRHSNQIQMTCTWSSYANEFNEELLFQCQNGVISGIHSYHSNFHEDRRFKFKCCRTEKNCVSNCFWTGYVNNWNATMDYSIPMSYHFVGAKSVYDSEIQDRRWRFLVCMD